MRRKQRGGGFLNTMGSMNALAKYLEPLQRAAPRVLVTGMKMMNDVDVGKSWKNAALDRIPESLKQAASGQPLQLGSGIRRRRIIKKKRKTKR